MLSGLKLSGSKLLGSKYALVDFAERAGVSTTLLVLKNF
jgi:hypothetical protein